MISNRLARFIIGVLALPVSSCALIGKVPKTVVDVRGYQSGEYKENIWSERYTVTGTATKASAGRPVGYFIKPDWQARRENITYAWPLGYPEIELQPGTRYRVHMISHHREMRDSSGVRSYPTSEVERIQTLDGTSILDVSRCPLHQSQMRWDWETAGSTEDYFNTPFFKIRSKTFPHDGHVYLPCGSGYYRQKRWICGDCETACDQTVKRLGITRY